MYLSNFIKKSLRNRIVLGMMAMLLPLLLMSVANYYSSRYIIGSLEGLANAGMHELEPISELQKLMISAAMPPNDYLIHGDTEERALFERISQEIAAKFFDLLAKSSHEGKKELLLSAYNIWQSAEKDGMQLLDAPNPVGNQKLGEDMEAFDERIANASAILSRIHDLVYDQIARDLQAAYAIKRKESLAVMVIFVIGFATAIFSGFLLARSITLPLSKLQKVVTRFSNGDHSSRLNIDRQDELGDLARTFNLMAERLEYDSLTGVYNRHEFHRRLKTEMERCSRYNHAVSLLMMDLDHFKAVNDTHGHQCGDEALRQVADVARREFRSSDMLARYGGEEFIAILPETDGEVACKVAERIRMNIAERPLMLSSGKCINLTISIGVAVFPLHARIEDHLVEAADMAMYAAKKAGRNRVSLFAGSANTEKSA